MTSAGAASEIVPIADSEAAPVPEPDPASQNLPWVLPQKWRGALLGILVLVVPIATVITLGLVVGPSSPRITNSSNPPGNPFLPPGVPPSATTTPSLVTNAPSADPPISPSPSSTSIQSPGPSTTQTPTASPTNPGALPPQGAQGPFDGTPPSGGSGGGFLPPLSWGPSGSTKVLQPDFNWTALGQQEDNAKYPICANRSYDPFLEIKIGSTPKPHQWRGWGTSLSWWTRQIAQYPEADYQRFLGLLFDKETGLGLNMVRYQVPTPYNSTLSPKVSRNPSFVQGFKTEPDGEYDWSADAAQVRVLREIGRFSVDHIQAYSNSPPWWMTRTGDVSGSEDGASNFREEYAPDFVEYMLDVMQHLEQDPSLNISFNAIAPFNEALDNWWFANTTKIGCSFSPKEASAVVEELANQMQQRGMTAGISIMDSWPSITTRLVSNSLSESFTDAALDAVSQFNVHGYVFIKGSDRRMVEEGVYKEIYSGAQERGKEVWQTEWGPAAFSGTELQYAVRMARVLCQHINYLGASAWFLWQAIQPRNTRGWGPVQYQKNMSEAPYVWKAFHVMRQFIQSLPPGVVLMEVDDDCGMGLVVGYDTEKQILSVTMVNQLFKPVYINLDTSDYSPSSDKDIIVLVYRSSAVEDYQLIDQYLTNDTTIEFVASPISVTTLLLGRVVPGLSQ